MKHIKTIACFCLLASQLPANAQQFGIELNAGLQGLNYGITNGSAKLQPGGSLGVNYTFLFAKKWGLLTGIYGNYYATKATLQDGATFSSYHVDDAGSAFLYHVKTVGYSETQQLLTAGIPVMLQYHTTGNGAQWYINAGTRIILPFHGKIKAKASQVTSSGYYPDFNIEVVDLPQHGFGTVSNWQSNTKMDFKPTATASAATGISFKFSGTTRLYTGIYADYGLTNMRKGDANQSMVTYSATSASAIQTASILNTPYAGNPKLLAFGLQVRLTLEKHKTKAKPQQQPAPPPPVLKQIVLVDTVKPAPVQQSQPKEQPAPVQPAAVPAISSREEAVVSQPLTFEKIGETSVPDKLKSHLDSVVVILLQYPDLRVEVKGYTCDIGTEKRNLHIGEERAKAVAVYLQQKGVAESRIDIRSAGESEPLVPNTSETNRMLNRRVTIIIEE